MAVKADIEKCDACWKCMDVCPNSSLEKANDGTKDHIKVNEDACIDCFLCLDECKTGCLQQPEEPGGLDAGTTVAGQGLRAAGCS